MNYDYIRQMDESDYVPAALAKQLLNRIDDLTDGLADAEYQLHQWELAESMEREDAPVEK